MTVQTIGALTDHEKRVLQIQAELRATGANPAGLLLLLGALIRDGEDTLLADLTAAGIDLEYLLRAIMLTDPQEELSHDLRDRNETTRATMRRLILGDIQPPAGPGEVGRGRDRLRNTKPVEETDDATYVIARLKRDDPELAQQVINGDLSAHAAAIKAGIRKPRVSVRTDNPTAAVTTLLKHFTRDQLLSALESP